jgi:hypothetical protein
VNIHAFVKNTDHLDLFIREKVVKHYVALERILAKAWLNVVAGISQFGRIGQHSRSFVQSFQVMPALCASPAFFGKTGNSTQVIFGSMGKRKCTHLIQVFIELSHKSLVAVLSRPAGSAFCNQMA